MGAGSGNAVQPCSRMTSLLCFAVRPRAASSDHVTWYVPPSGLALVPAMRTTKASTPSPSSARPITSPGSPVTVLHGSGSRAHWPLPRPGSSGADVGRASQLQHAVQVLDRHVHLSRPTLVRTRAQPVPDHALEPADGGLGPGAGIVARGLLPAHPALLGDELQVAVPLRRRGLGRGAGHGG